jgi:hypothetical protein
MRVDAPKEASQLPPVLFRRPNEPKACGVSLMVETACSIRAAECHDGSGAAVSGR